MSDKTRTVIGVIVLGAITLGLLGWVNVLHRSNGQLQTDVAEARRLADTALVASESLHAQAAALEEAIEELGREMDALLLARKEAPSLKPTNTPDFMDSMTDAFSESMADAMAEGMKEITDSFEKEGIDFGEIMKMSAGMMNNPGMHEMQFSMEWGELLPLLGLDDAREAEVHDIIVASMAGQFSFMGDMGEDFDFKELMEQQMNFEPDAPLREELAAVLTAEELAVFDEYEAGSEERQMRQSLDMGLSMMGPSVSFESRQVILDVLVEESLALSEALRNAEPASDMFGQAMENQVIAMENSLDRLVDYLDEDEYATFERYVQSQSSIMESMSGMMGGLFGMGD